MNRFISGLVQFKKSLKVRQSLFITIIIFNSIYALVIGVYLKNQLANIIKWNFFEVLFILILLFVFALLNWLIIEFSNHNKIEFIDEISSTIKLRDKDLLNEMLVNSLDTLNYESCVIINYENRICDTELDKGLLSLIQPFLSTIEKILSLKKNDYGFGVYLQKYYLPELPSGTKDESKIFYYSSNNDLHTKFDHEIFFQASGADFFNQKIKQLIELSYQQKTFISECFGENADNKNFTGFFSFVPDMCEFQDTSGGGVIFFISKKKCDCNEELKFAFTIFGWIVANYIGKYNDCVKNSLPSQALPPNLQEQDLQK